MKPLGATQAASRQALATRLEMPNRHHLPIDVSKFGMKDRNEVFLATEEPHGLIKATLSR